jgi:hypothetical protein
MAIMIDRPAGFTQRVVNAVLKFYSQWWDVKEDSDDRDGSYFTFKTPKELAEKISASA